MIRLFIFALTCTRIFSFHKDCFTTGNMYKGTKHITEDGVECIYWDRLDNYILPVRCFCLVDGFGIIFSGGQYVGSSPTIAQTRIN